MCYERIRDELLLGKSVRGASDEIGRRGRNDDDVGLAGEADVIEGVAGTKDLRMNLASGDRLERDGTHEFARRARHHDVDFSSGLCKQTRQPH